MANKIYLEPEELKTICDEILTSLEDAEIAKTNLRNTYSVEIEGMDSDFITKLKDSMEITDINAVENAISVLSEKVNSIKLLADIMIETDENMLEE